KAAEPVKETAVESAQEVSLEIDGEQKTEIIPFDIVRLQKLREPDELFVPTQDLIFLSPNEEARRFPLLTRVQKALIGIGVGLLILLSVIAYLLWRQQKGDQSKNFGPETALADRALAPNPLLPTNPTPTPPGDTPGYDDVSIAESVK